MDCNYKYSIICQIDFRKAYFVNAFVLFPLKKLLIESL
jgi:hypothetical protein